MAIDPTLADDAAAVPPDRFCDLVMKGGVTSGIVYPGVIATLARSYRFKSIGGTSAGAIAAVATAAAEYQRRTKGSGAGFKLVAELPDVLQKESDGGTRLLRLFQPYPRCKRLFRILVGMLNRKSARKAAVYALGHAVLAYVWLFVLAAPIAWGIAMLLGGGMADWLASIVLMVLVALLAMAALIYRAVTRDLVAGDYGLCSGLSTNRADDADEKKAALTPWLHALIQGCAGDGAPDPLTFADLWSAPGAPVAARDAPAELKRSIDLRMFTTNLHHGRPYLLPHDSDHERLFFRREDMMALLPKHVVEFMCKKELTYVRKRPDEPPADAPHLQKQLEGLYELTPANFPILLAARLSLSFPLLLCTVRLWVIDFEAPESQRGFRACTFSDGGLCSNFPIHLFDGVLPSWPTFGIQLEPLLDDRQTERVFLPNRYESGLGERWSDFDRKHDSPAKLFGFISALVDAMQNWNDNSLARMPGVRDRVVRVRLNDDEGGLNLNMPKALVDDVASLGTKAGRALESRFVNGPGWDEQRLVRLGVLVKALEAKLANMPQVWTGVPHAVDYPVLLQGNGSASPGFDAALGAQQVAAIEQIVRALDALTEALNQHGSAYAFKAIPQATLRVRPSI